MLRQQAGIRFACSSCHVLLCLAECADCCATAVGQSGRAALVACAARRWLARNAAAFKTLVYSKCAMDASESMRLVSCLPALEDVSLCLIGLIRGDLACLLEALARCPRLRALDLDMIDDDSHEGGHEDLQWPFPDPQLVQLPQLQRLVFWSDTLWDDVVSGAALGLFRLPVDMGLLASTLLHVELSGLGLRHFPLALTQLVALECLDASMNGFAELAVGVTALSRLRQLMLGRSRSPSDPLQLRQKSCLGVRALGDLSGFPALRSLTFYFCEVSFCHSMLDAVRHAWLTSISFCTAHPAPECAPMVLQLSQALRRMGRGSVLRFCSNGLALGSVRDALDHAQGQAPCQKFMADLKACGL